MDFIFSCVTVTFVTDLTYNLLKVSEAFSTQFLQLFITSRRSEVLQMGNAIMLGEVRCCKWEMQ